MQYDRRVVGEAVAAPEETAVAAVGAVVTGGAGGLGRAIGAELARRGHRVRLADLDLAAAEAAAADLGSSATGVRLDVTDRAAVHALAGEVAGTDGLAVWVNNAGILRTGPSWAHDPDEVHTLFDVNVHGTIHGTTAAVDVMRRSGGGHIVNVVSLAGLVAPPGETVYAATKHAALAYTVGTAQDLRLHGVAGLTLTAMCPDGIWTPMLHDLVDDPEAALSWSGTLLTPEQVATQVGRALDRRSPLVSVPRWRGGLARASSTFPRIALRVGPAVVAHARRKQARFAAAHRDR